MRHVAVCRKKTAFYSIFKAGFYPVGKFRRIMFALKVKNLIEQNCLWFVRVNSIFSKDQEETAF